METSRTPLTSIWTRNRTVVHARLIAHSLLSTAVDCFNILHIHCTNMSHKAGTLMGFGVDELIGIGHYVTTHMDQLIYHKRQDTCVLYIKLLDERADDSMRLAKY